MTIAVGDTAPAFILPDSDQQSVSLADFAGRKAALVVFYPFAFSGLCTGELTAVRNDLAIFQNEQVQVLAVSTDPTYTLKAWSRAERLEFPLLSDFWPHGAVAQSYGVFNDRAGMAVRGTFLVGTDGLVTLAEVNGPGEPRDQSAWKRAIAALPG